MSTVDIRIYIPENLKHYFPSLGSKISGEDSWRNTVLLPYIHQRESHFCWVDDCWNRSTECHESCVTRQDVRGWDWDRKVLIHSPFNVIALCKKHHKIAPGRMDVLNWMLNYYDARDVIKWYATLPFVAHPLKGFLEKVSWLPEWLERWNDEI